MIVFVQSKGISDSTRQVLLLLKSKNKALTTKRISKSTGIPKRTVRYALNQLEELEVISERPAFNDLRKVKYSLNQNLNKKKG